MDFEKHINEFKTIIPFKNTIDIGDIILFILPDIFIYGIVKKIEKDNLKKGDWWYVTFTAFSIPPKNITLILRSEQMTGMETFTINGEYRFFSAIDINNIEKKEIKEQPKATRTKLTLIKNRK